MSLQINEKNLTGKWIATKNIYLISEKKTYTYKETIYINKCPNKKYKLSYLDKQKIYYIYYKENNIIANKIITVFDSSNNYSYQINDIQNNYIKLNSSNKKNNIICHEYIYCINAKFKISIAFLIKSHKYLATMFTSYIKNSD